MSNISPAPFSQSWKIEDTVEICEHERQRHPPEGSGYHKWIEDHRPLMDRLVKAVAGHILHLAATTGLPLPPHSEAVKTNWLSYWRLASNQELLKDHQLELLGRSVYRGFSGIFSRVNGLSSRPALSDQEIHEMVVEKIHSGDFSSYEVENSSCMASGLNLFVALKGWAPTLLAFNPSTRRFDPLVDGQVKTPGLEYVEISFPTGELLIADWFRHDAFTSATETVLDGAPSINSEDGCVERTMRLAKQLNLVNVFVGNSSPSIFVDEGGLVVGNELYEDGETSVAAVPVGTEIGSVCTDLWWATIIDRQVLTEILARTLSKEESEAAMAEILEDKYSSINQVQVKPGTYHLYFAGEPSTFANTFSSDEVPLNGYSEPMFALRNSKLDILPQTSSKRTPGP